MKSLVGLLTRTPRKLEKEVSCGALGKHPEIHKSECIGWLRAAVLGANDGILSTSSLIVGVAAANAHRSEILLSGVAGLVAGAMSTAAGEYVSVSSQADTEHADLALEGRELASSPASEKVELARIYIDRGLDSELASKVADQLMAHDALKSHARDELGITETGVARPIQAALASAATFTVGAALPLTVVLVAPYESLVYSVSVASLFFLLSLESWRHVPEARIYRKVLSASDFGAPSRW